MQLRECLQILQVMLQEVWLNMALTMVAPCAAISERMSRVRSGSLIGSSGDGGGRTTSNPGLKFEAAQPVSNLLPGSR